MRIGVDLGGTKIAAIALGDDNAVLWEARRATPRDDYGGTVGAIAALVEEGERVAGVRGSVGIGTPGAVSPLTGRMKNCNSTWLNGRPLKEDLETRLRRPVRLANDANCLALSEAADGAAAGADVVFGVILGTGVGGGLVVRGWPVIGANAIGGEWGHNPLPWPDDHERPGPECYCGRRGCIETFLSGPGLAADYVRRGGTPMASESIVERAAMAAAVSGMPSGAGPDPIARAALDAWHDRLARALATLVNVVDPDVIVLGGGLSRVPDLPASIASRLGRWVFSDHVATRIEPARHGDASGVRGAARLWGGA